MRSSESKILLLGFLIKEKDTASVKRRKQEVQQEKIIKAKEKFCLKELKT